MIHYDEVVNIKVVLLANCIQRECDGWQPRHALVKVIDVDVWLADVTTGVFLFPRENVTPLIFAPLADVVHGRRLCALCCGQKFTSFVVNIRYVRRGRTY